MSPAVAHLDVVVGRDGCRSRRCGGRGTFGVGVCRIVISGLARGEDTETFLVGAIEVRLEVDPRFVGVGLVIPFAQSIGEDSRLLKYTCRET